MSHTCKTCSKSFAYKPWTYAYGKNTYCSDTCRDITKHAEPSEEEIKLSCTQGEGQENVSSPKHYRQHPSGIECIQVTEHFGFTLGNVIKYIWRADLKGGLEDLKKARWYIEREILNREAKDKGND